MNSGDDFFALSKTPNSQQQIENQNGVLMSQPASERQSMLNEKIKQFVHTLRKDQEELVGSQINPNGAKMNAENDSLNLGGITSEHQLVSPVHSQIKVKLPDVDGLANIRRESRISLNRQPSSETNKESVKNESHVQINPYRTSRTLGASEKMSGLGLFQSTSKMDTDKPTGSKLMKIKGLNQVSPMPFSYRNQATFQENNLESNLSKMVKFVKIKKKIGEMKRNVLRNGLIKKFISKAGNPFNQVLNDLVSNLPSDKNDIGTCWSLGGFLMSIFCLNSVLALLKKIPTIEPSSKFKLVWDLVVGTSFMIFFFFIPVHIAINQPIQDLVTAQLGYVLNCIMGVDIIFSMITGYFEKGVNTSDKKKILLFYIKNYFWSDIISQIPLLVSELGSSDSQYEKIFVMCFFVKIRNFQKIFRKFEESFHLSPRVSNIISLIKLLLIILFFSHIFGCLWIYVGNNQSDNSSTWLKKINLQDDDWKQQYIAAYYFSTVTMITVGYGDINPMNNLERMVSVGTMLVSCIIFAYTINQIGTIFSDLFSQDRQLKEFFYIINEYMDNKNIGFSLQYKIREYLDFYWREQDQNKSELEKKIIDSLSDQLREKLMIEANRIVLKDSGIFHHNFNSAVILKMIPLIQMIHTTPNQIIFQEGQIDDDMFIYFIEKGAIEICREFVSADGSKMSKIISTLGPGSCFGSWSFITNQQRREMARSSEFSKLLLIRRSDFLELIQENPQDVERFCFLKDSILMEKNLEYLEIRCQACMSYNHEIQHCHFFHYSPDKYVIIKRNNLKTQKQNRDETFSRKQRFVQLKPTLNMLDIKSSNSHWKEAQQETIDQYKQEYLQHEHHYNDGIEYQDPYYFEGQYDQGSEEFDEEMGEDFYDEDEQGQDNEEEQFDENEEDSDNNNNNNNNLNRKKSSSISSKNSKQSASSSTKQRRNNKFKQQRDSDAIKEEEEREGEMTASNMRIQNQLNLKAADLKRIKNKSVSASEEDDSNQMDYQSMENPHKLNVDGVGMTHSIRKSKLDFSNSLDDKNQSSSSDKKHSQVASNNDEIINEHKAKAPSNNALTGERSGHPNKQQCQQDDYFAELEQNNQEMEGQEEEQSPQKLTLRIPSKILDRKHSIKELQNYSPQLITFNAKENSDDEPDYQIGFINSLQGEDEQLNFQYESLQYIDDFNSVNNDKKLSSLSKPSSQVKRQKGSLVSALSPDKQQSQSSIASKSDKDTDRHLLKNNLMDPKNSSNKKSFPELELNAQRLSPSVDYRGHHEENRKRETSNLSGFSQNKTPAIPSLSMVPSVTENDYKQDQQQRKKTSILRRRAKKMQTGLINEVRQENDNHLQTQQMLPQLGSVILDRPSNKDESNDFQAQNRKFKTFTQLPNYDIPKGRKKKGITDPELKLQSNAENQVPQASKSHPILRSNSRAKSFQSDGFKKIKHQQQQDNQDFTSKYQQQQFQNRQHQVRIAKTEQTTTPKQTLERKNSSESMKSSSSQAAKNQHASSPAAAGEVSINLGVHMAKRKSNFAINLKDDASKNIVQKYSSIPSNLLLKVPGDQQILANSNEKQGKNKVSLNSINTSINQANRSDSNHSQNNLNRIDQSPTSTISLKQHFLKRNVLSIEEPLSELRKYSLVNKKDPMGKRNSFSIQSPANNVTKYNNSGIIGRRSFSKLGSFAAVDSLNSQKSVVDQTKASPKMQQQLYSGHKMQMKASLGIFQPSAFLERSPIGQEGQGTLVAPQILLNNTNNINNNSGNNSANKNLMLQLTTPSQTQIQQPSPSANNQTYNPNAASNNRLNMDDIADEPMNNLFQIMNFDELKNFPFYFPKSNSTKVIHKANIIINNNYMKLMKRKKNKLGNIKRNFKFEEIINQSRRPSLLLKKPTLQKKQTMHFSEYPSLRNISPPI